MSQPFDESTLASSAILPGAELDALPFGAIVVDREGTILDYNTYESELSHRSREAVLDFQGRFRQWIDAGESDVRQPAQRDRATIAVKRRRED